MRIKQAGKNIKYTTIAYVLRLTLQFIVRLVFVKSLPIEYLGINGLFTNLLAMLSLAELGVGPAITYSLYKPLAEKDTETITALMRVFKKAYVIIGIFIIVVGICMLPWLDWFIKGNSIENTEWFYIIFLLNTGSSYFYSYKRNLLIADQKQYINSIYQCGGQVILAILQITFLLVYPSYWLYIVLILLTTVSENYMAAKKADRVYSYLQEEKNVQSLPGDIKNTIVKNIKAMIAHKIGGMAIFSTSNLILSKFVGLAAVGLYSNYYLIISAANSFAGQFFSSITASIGNLIALESNQKKANIFKVTEFIVAWQALVIGCGFFTLLNPLIEIWLGKQFLFDEAIVTYLIINFYLMYMRMAVNAFKNASGLYWNDRYKPIAEAVINLAASVYLTINYGVVGVIWGGIISTLLTCFWVEPYVLFRNGIDINLKDYFKDYLQYAVLTLLTAAVSKWIYTSLFNEVSIINFILGVILCFAISNVAWIAVFRKREEMAYLRNVARDKFGMNFF